MRVDELIEKLKEIPPHYEVPDKIRVEDTEGYTAGLELDVQKLDDRCIAQIYDDFVRWY